MATRPTPAQKAAETAIEKHDATEAAKTATQQTMSAATETKPEIAAPAEQPAPSAPAKPAEPTSAKLTELKAERLKFKTLARTFEPDSDDENAALLEAYKIDQLIKAEIANIANTEREAANQIARNQRVKLNNDQLEAAKALWLFEASNPTAAEPVLDGAEPTAEQLQHAVLADAFKAAMDIVNTELLAKFAAPSKPAAPKADGTPNTGGKQTDEKLLAMLVAGIAAGLTDSVNRKAAEAAGYARSTVWHALNNYKLAHGIAKA